MATFTPILTPNGEIFRTQKEYDDAGVGAGAGSIERRRRLGSRCARTESGGSGVEVTPQSSRGSGIRL